MPCVVLPTTKTENRMCAIREKEKHPPNTLHPGALKFCSLNRYGV